MIGLVCLFANDRFVTLKLGISRAPIQSWSRLYRPGLSLDVTGPFPLRPQEREHHFELLPNTFPNAVAWWFEAAPLPTFEWNHMESISWNQRLVKTNCGAQLGFASQDLGIGEPSSCDLTSAPKRFRAATSGATHWVQAVAGGFVYKVLPQSLQLGGDHPQKSRICLSGTWRPGTDLQWAALDDAGADRWGASHLDVQGGAEPWHGGISPRFNMLRAWICMWATEQN